MIVSLTLSGTERKYLVDALNAYGKRNRLGDSIAGTLAALVERLLASTPESPADLAEDDAAAAAHDTVELANIEAGLVELAVLELKGHTGLQNLERRLLAIRVEA